MGSHLVSYARPAAPAEEAAATALVEGDPAVVEDRLTARALDHARQGDSSAVHFLFVRHADELCAYIAGIVQDRGVAERIVQDVFADLVTAVAEPEERPVPFAAAIVRAATNMALEFLRGRKNGPHTRSSTNGRGARQRGSLGRALAVLPREQREVIVLRNAAGLSLAQTAELLGRSERATEGLHERGRSSLRAALIGAESEQAANG